DETTMLSLVLICAYTLVTSKCGRSLFRAPSPITAVDSLTGVGDGKPVAAGLNLVHLGARFIAEELHSLHVKIADDLAGFQRNVDGRRRIGWDRDIQCELAIG